MGNFPRRQWYLSSFKSWRNLKIWKSRQISGETAWGTVLHNCQDSGKEPFMLFVLVMGQIFYFHSWENRRDHFYRKELGLPTLQGRQGIQGSWDALKVKTAITKRSRKLQNCKDGGAQGLNQIRQLCAEQRAGGEPFAWVDLLLRSRNS